MASKGGFGAIGEGLVHPITGFRFFGALEGDALHIEFSADEVIEIDATNEDVAAEDGGGVVVNRKLVAEALISFHGEEGDLAFIVLLVVEKAVADDAFACDEFNLVDFDHGGVSCGLAVVAEVVVRRRNVEVFDGHYLIPTGGRFLWQQQGIRVARQRRIDQARMAIKCL